MDNLKEKAEKGFLWEFGESVLGHLVSFIVSIILARILLPEQYGTVAIIMIFIGLATPIATSGFATSLVRKTKVDQVDYDTIFLATEFFSLILYIILFGLAPYIANGYGDPIAEPALKVMGITLFITAYNSVQKAYVQREMSFKKFFFASLIGTIASAVVGIVMAYKGFGVWALVAQKLTDQAVDTFILAFFVKWKPKFRFSLEKFGAHYHFSWRMSLTGFIGVVFDNLKGLIVGYKFKSEDLGYYKKGESFPKLFGDQINGPINSVMFSAYSKIKHDKPRLRNALSKSLMLSSFALVPIYFGLAAIAPVMIPVLITNKWIEAVPYLQFASIGLLISTLGQYDDQIFKSTGRSDVALKLELIKKPIFLAIIIGCAFVSPLAIMIGSVCYSFIALCINSFASKKLVGFGLIERIKVCWRSIVIGGIMFAAVYFEQYIPINQIALLFIEIATGGIIYFVLSKLMNKKQLKEIVKEGKEFIARKRNNKDKKSKEENSDSKENTENKTDSPQEKEKKE